MTLSQSAVHPDALPALSLEVCEQAMHWWLELQGAQVDAKTVSACNRWRGEHRLHEMAWQRAERLAGQLQAFRDTGDAGKAKSALLSPATSGISRRKAIKHLALLLAAGTVAWQARDTALVQRFSTDYSTDTGERRHLTLATGLEVQLNTRSALNARMIDHHWEIDLLKGEVLIDTAVKPALLLRTAQVDAWTESAQLSARVFENGTTLLSVYRGSLQIAASGARPAAILGQGQQALFNPALMLERRPLDPSATAWTQGMIVANGQPLQAFLDELGRYRHGHLGCEPALANLKVWGTFPLADSDRVIDAVADTLKLDVQRFTRLWVNLRRSQKIV